MNDSELLSFYCNDQAIRIADGKWLGDDSSAFGGEEFLAACWEIAPSDCHSPIPAELGADVFRLDDNIQKQLPPAVATGLAANNIVVRLAELQACQAPFHAKLQLANYFDSARSNFAMEVQISAGRTLRQQLHGRNASVGPLADSLLVNHLGVVGMVRTADDQWIIPQRSGKVLNRKRTSSASVSGAVSPVDLETHPLELGQILRAALRRECSEELAIPLTDVTMIGLLREFRRGGKPEAYFFARTPLTLAAARERWSEASDDQESTQILGSVAAPPNFTLRAGLALARQFI